MHWGPWFLGACALVALLLVLAGAGIAFVEFGRVKRRAEAIVPLELIARASMAQANAERLAATLARTEAEVPRLNAALAAISAALRELKLAFAYRR